MNKNTRQSGTCRKPFFAARVIAAAAVKAACAFAFLGAAAAPLHALTVDLFSIQGNSPATGFDFENITTNSQYNSAKQYLRIDNPESADKLVRIYSNNTNWAGSLQADRSGLILMDTLKDRAPLYWTAVGSLQTNGLPFSQGMETSWHKMIDINNPDFVQTKDAAVLTVPANKTVYIYLGSIIPSDIPSGNYQTRLVVESAPNGSFNSPPTLSYMSCERALLLDPMVFKASVGDDAGVKSATLNYRYLGEASYRTLNMNLGPDPKLPGRQLAQVSVPKGQLQAGILQYYYLVNDGSLNTYGGNPAAPNTMQIVNEFDEIPLQVDPGQPRSDFVQPECSEATGVPELAFSPGSILASMQISAKKLAAGSVPPLNGQAPTTAYEFGPSGTQFKAPVSLSLSYPDTNNDGIVDGTTIDAKTLKVFWWDGIAWRNLGGTVDTDQRTVTASISHFSTYALFAAGAPSAAEIRPKENIVTPNGDGKNDVAQFGISGQFDIKILDIQGRTVRHLHDINSWDGRDDSGDIVESGAYIYQVKAAGVNVSGTIGVAR